MLEMAGKGYMGILMGVIYIYINAYLSLKSDGCYNRHHTPNILQGPLCCNLFAEN
jgi:hypothetical protein